MSKRTRDLQLPYYKKDHIRIIDNNVDGNSNVRLSILSSLSNLLSIRNSKRVEFIEDLLALISKYEKE